jgi:vitamin K-dependent gamma-carboxylase-like protein
MTSRLVVAWNRFWFQPVESSTVALFRVAFGLLALGYTLSLAPVLFAFYSDDGILPAQPTYSGTLAWGLLGFFPSDAAVVLFYFLLLVGTIALLAGFRARLAALVVFVCIISFGRRDPWVLNSGDLLVQVLAFYMLFMPSGTGLSVDRWLNEPRRFWEFPARAIWPLRLVQVQVSILYLAAVWAKVRGVTWNDGTAVSYAFRIDDIARFPVPGFVTDSLVLANLLTYGTLAVELSIGILVWNRILRPWVLLLGIGLHLGIDYAVRVGFFSYAVLVAYIVFIPPEAARSFILATRDRVARLTLPRWAPLARRPE